MRQSVYVVQSFKHGINHVLGNTDWRQIKQDTFIKPDESEQITLVTRFENVRGSTPHMVYVDDTFCQMPDQDYINFCRYFQSRSIKMQVIKERW